MNSFYTNLNRILLKAITPCLIILFSLLARELFFYIRNAYAGGFGYFQTFQKNNYVNVSIEVEAEKDFQRTSRGMYFNLISIHVSKQPNVVIDEFCLNNLYFSWNTTKLNEQMKVVASSPFCLSLKQSNFNGFDYKFDLRDYISNNNLVFGHSESTNFINGVFYPFDSQYFNFIFWGDYSIKNDNVDLEKGTIFLSSDISGFENLTEDNWEVQYVGKIESSNNKDILVNELGFTRPLIIRLLFAAVFVLAFSFILITFFIKNTDVYLASALAILFGFLGIKQLFTLPPDVSVNFGLIDLTLLMLYILMGISGINFLIKNILNNESKTKILKGNEKHVIKKANRNQ